MGDGPRPRQSLRALFQSASDAIDQVVDHLEHPVIQTRLDSLTVPGTAEVVGVASIPGNVSGGPNDVGAKPEGALLRLEVTGEDGRRFETAALQEAANGIVRQLAPGLVVSVRSHPREPKAAVHWGATARLVGRELEWRDSMIEWPPADEWPAIGAIEVRWRTADARRLDERRRSWAAGVASFVSLEPHRTAYDQGRKAYVVTMTWPGTGGAPHTFPIDDAVPELMSARLVEVAPPHPGSDRNRLVWRVGAPLDVLVEPSGSGEVAVDWERTLNRPEHRSLPPVS
jgi:hypothetical protein